MSMRSVVAWAALMAMVGCSGAADSSAKAPAKVAPDPAFSRLETGSEAIAFTAERDTEERVAIYVPDLDPLRRPPLMTGDRLMIVEDDGDPADPGRRVHVHVETGALSGHSGDMARRDIRPRPR